MARDDDGIHDLESMDDDEIQELSPNDGIRDGGGDHTSDEAQHLIEDVEGEQFGTDDVGTAVEQGLSYNPPDSPVQEGSWSKENH